MYLSKLEREALFLKTALRPGLRALPLPVVWRLRGLLRTEKCVRVGQRIVINSFLPPFPSQAFDGMAAHLAAIRQGHSIPLSAYVAVTGRCRYQCWHCSRAHRAGVELATPVLRRTLAELQDLGVSIIGFTGGEPLRRDDLEDLVGAVDQRSVSILFTTGDGLTRTRCQHLQQRGLFAAAVSLDHYTAAVHDERRGSRGAFDTALQAIRLFQDHGIYTMLQLVATRDLARRVELDRYLDLAERLKIHEIRILEPMPAGCLLGDESGSFLSDEERRELRDLHLKTNRIRKLPKVTAFAQIESEHMYGCGAGMQHLYIDPQGHVCPCDFTPVSFGRAGDEALGAIWARMTDCFRSPRTTCFVAENATWLRTAMQADQPVSYQALSKACRGCDTRPQIPRFYRLLGWRPATTVAAQNPIPDGQARPDATPNPSLGGAWKAGWARLLCLMLGVSIMALLVEAAGWIQDKPAADRTATCGLHQVQSMRVAAQQVVAPTTFLAW